MNKKLIRFVTVLIFFIGINIKSLVPISAQGITESLREALQTHDTARIKGLWKDELKKAKAEKYEDIFRKEASQASAIYAYTLKQALQQAQNEVEKAQEERESARAEYKKLGGDRALSSNGASFKDWIHGGKEIHKAADRLRRSHGIIAEKKQFGSHKKQAKRLSGFRLQARINQRE